MKMALKIALNRTINNT